MQWGLREYICNEKLTLKEFHFPLYQQTTRRIYGLLRYGQRKQLPACIKEFIKDLYSDEYYVGFVRELFMMKTCNERNSLDVYALQKIHISY